MTFEVFFDLLFYVGCGAAILAAILGIYSFIWLTVACAYKGKQQFTTIRKPFHD